MSGIQQKVFGKLDDGYEVKLFELVNKNGMKVELLDYGATIRAIKVLNKKDEEVDVALGFDSIDWYLGKHARNPFFGSTVGRVANRIADGKFELDGVSYKLAQNNGENSLHGGLVGFDKVVWNAKPNEAENSVSFTYLSKDGEEGYPGDVIVNVTFNLNNDNCLGINFKALVTKATPINLTNHVYFNLGGHASGSDSLKNHLVQINAQHYLPVNNDNLIPLGELRPVEDSQFDLRSPKILGNYLTLDGPKAGGDRHGFDHTFCINPAEESGNLREACKVTNEATGITLACFTDQPGMQFYTGNFLPTDGSLKGKEGCTYTIHGGFCLETQKFPDAINQPFKDNSVIRPGQVYQHQVIYQLNSK